MPDDERYLDLLEGLLTRTLEPERYRPLAPALRQPAWYAYEPVRRILGAFGLELVRPYRYDRHARSTGLDRPPEALTMIGTTRLHQLRVAVETVVAEEVPGDIIETGVWRGGASLMAKAVLVANGDTTRTVWLADSFTGLPKPELAQDAKVDQWRHTTLQVSEREVRATFERFGLLDERVRFLPGWFKDTLPRAPIEQLAVLRLDGDLYASTMDALRPLYDKVSPGGYVIADDYGAMIECRRAIDDFRRERDITEPLEWIDTHGVFWRVAR